MEENLQEQLGDHLHFRNLKCSYNAWYWKSLHMFALALTVPRYYNLKYLTLKSKPSSLCVSIAILSFIGQLSKSIKIDMCIFCSSSFHFRDKNLNFVFSNSRSKSRSAIFEIKPFDGKWQNLQMSLTHFCASSYHLRDIKIFNFYFQK